MKEENLEHRFIVECEAFSRLDGNDPYDKEAMGILYEFVQKEIFKAKQETWDKAIAAFPKDVDCDEHYVDFSRIMVKALKEAKEKDI